MRTENPATIRDRASRRVRRLTAFAIAGATALTAAFAGLAAGSTHTHKRTATTPAKTTSATTKSVTAPLPSLIPNGSTATPQAPTPQQTVTPSTQAPVAVSGGS